MTNPILIVEDDKKIARVVKIYLEEAGFRTIHAEKGKDAIESALKDKPLLVILDLMLPDTSGEELIQELKEDRRFSRNHAYFKVVRRRKGCRFCPWRR